MFNIIKPNSSSKKLPDGHSFTLGCKILNVNFLKPQSRVNTSSFLTLGVLGTKLRAISVSHHTSVSAAIAPERQWITTSYWSKCLHALFLLFDNVFDLLNLVLIPFESTVVFLSNLCWIWPIFHFGVCPHSRELPWLILFLTHTRWRCNLWWPIVNFCPRFVLGQSLAIKIVNAVSILSEDLFRVVILIPTRIGLLTFLKNVFCQLVTKIL